MELGLSLRSIQGQAEGAWYNKQLGEIFWNKRLGSLFLLGNQSRSIGAEPAQEFDFTLLDAPPTQGPADKPIGRMNLRNAIALDAYKLKEETNNPTPEYSEASGKNDLQSWKLALKIELRCSER